MSWKGEMRGGGTGRERQGEGFSRLPSQASTTKMVLFVPNDEVAGTNVGRAGRMEMTNS